MSRIYEKLMKTYDSIRERVPFQPKVALVLGSGLGEFAETIQVEATIPYNEIDGFPISTVAGHKGRFVLGYVGDVPVVIMQGRVHYYEGYSMEEVVLPIRLMKQMGAEILFLTNAAGGINTGFKAGDFMMMTDHIACFVPNPLIGANADELGPRFPDMTCIYNQELCKLIRNAANESDISIQEGVYAQMTGPSYECPAEVRMLRTLGADAVGMSTACEAIAANHMGMKVCGISCISNMASGITNQPLNHEEVQKTADEAAVSFKKLITESILKMKKTC